MFGVLFLGLYLMLVPIVAFYWREDVQGWPKRKVQLSNYRSKASVLDHTRTYLLFTLS
jgi:hypothetical protein